MSETVLRIGTRGSRLALAQARLVVEAMSAAQPDCRTEIVVIRTTGDAVLDRPLHEVGGKGAFTRELELALLNRRIDVAVHSCKDVPVTQPLAPVDQLVLACFPAREQACDVLVSTIARSLDELPRGARVGTSSPRRAALLLDVRPDLRVVPLRGNIDTRLKKLDAGECEALLLAKAGLLRAGLFDASRMHDLPVEQFVPAAGQGALAVQCRRDDERTISLIAPLDCPTTRRCVELERAVVRELQGDCHSAIGVHAKPIGSELLVHSALGVAGRVLRRHATVPPDESGYSSATRLARLLSVHEADQGPQDA